MSFCTSFSPHVASTLTAILMSGIVLDDLIIFGCSLGNQLKCPHFLFANVPLSLLQLHKHTQKVGVWDILYWTSSQLCCVKTKQKVSCQVMWCKAFAFKNCHQSSLWQCHLRSCGSVHTSMIHTLTCFILTIHCSGDVDTECEYSRAPFLSHWSWVFFSTLSQDEPQAL